MYNTIDVELIRKIKKANKLGINVITDGSTPSAKSLSIVITDDAIGGASQIFFDMISENGEITSLPSPFTWAMTREKFIEFVEISNKFVLRKIYQTLSRMVRMMPIEKFDILRRIPDLQNQVIKYLYDELAFLGIKPRGISLPMMLHVEMMYGGPLLTHDEGIEHLINDLFDMVIEKRYIPDKCRSCKFCRYDDDGRRYCDNPGTVFSIPMDTTIGNIIDAFPDLQIRVNANQGYAYTKYIPGYQKNCSVHKRRI